jgi:hypothetical protein
MIPYLLSGGNQAPFVSLLTNEIEEGGKASPSVTWAALSGNDSY